LTGKTSKSWIVNRTIIKKRSVSEMLHIKEQLNDFNTQKDTELLDNAYSDILDMLSGNCSY